MIDEDKSFADQLHESRLRYAAILFGNEFYHKTLVRQRRETIRWQTGLAVYPLEHFEISGFIGPYAHLASPFKMVYYTVPYYMRKPTLKLRGKTFAILKKSVCVYIWRRGKRYLFIGRTENFMHRMGKHNVIGKSDEVKPYDVIELFLCGTYDAAERMEERLRRKYQPIYSPSPAAMPRDCDPRECLVCHEIFTPKRYWQKFCKRCTAGAAATR